jgi:hypothetical protein
VWWRIAVAGFGAGHPEQKWRYIDMGVSAGWGGFAFFIYTYLRHLRNRSYFIEHFPRGHVSPFSYGEVLGELLWLIVPEFMK